MTETTGAVGPEERESRDRESEGTTGPVIRDKRRVDPQTGQVRQPAQESVTGGDDSFGGGVGDALPGSHGPHTEHTVTAAHEGEPSTYARQGDAHTQPAGTQADQVGSASADQVGSADEAGSADQAGSTDGDQDSPAVELHPDTIVAADRLEDLRRLQAEYVNYKRRVDRDRVKDREAGISAVVESLLPVLDDLHMAKEHGELPEGPLLAIADKLEATLGRFGVQRLGAVGEVFDPAVHEALMHLPEADLPEGATETTIVQVMQPGFRVGDRVVRAARVAVADPA